MISATIAQYRIQEKLREGGTGEVYLAEDTALNCWIGLKLLPPNLAQNQGKRDPRINHTSR